MKFELPDTLLDIGFNRRYFITPVIRNEVREWLDANITYSIDYSVINENGKVRIGVFLILSKESEMLFKLRWL